MYFFPVLHLFAGVFLFGAFLRFALSRQWFIRKYGRPVYQADRTQTLEMLRQGLPFALVSVFVTLYYYIDTVILTIFVDKEVVGQYNAAFRLLEAPLFIVSAVTTALFPAAARLFVQDRNKLKGLTRQAFQGIIPIGLTVSVPAAFFSDEIIQLIYGAKYSGAGPALSILIFSLSIIMPSTILGTTIRAIGFQTASAWVTGMGAVLNIVSNIAVIPYYSYIGASWTTLLTEVFVLIAYFSLASRYLGYFLDRWFPARVLAYVAGLELMLLATRAWGMWIQSGVFFVVFPVWMLVLGLVDPAITNRLRQKFRPAGKET
jgi:O-antigen/teichoic acid export membrane protein